MTHPSFIAPDFDSETNPYVGELVDRLLKTADEGKLKVDDKSWNVITEVLSFAVDAEQRLSQQRQQIAALESLSMTDPLTEIGNRRAFDDNLGRTLAAAKRHGERGVLAIFDLDNFKRINDGFGHEVGDLVLRRVAQSLTVNIRPFDFVARIGGDEFAVILVRSDPQGGIRRLKAIRAALDGMTLEVDDRAVGIHLSLGTAVFNRASTASGILRIADESMYRDKDWRSKQFGVTEG